MKSIQTLNFLMLIALRDESSDFADWTTRQLRAWVECVRCLDILGMKIRMRNTLVTMAAKTESPWTANTSTGTRTISATVISNNPKFPLTKIGWHSKWCHVGRAMETLNWFLGIRLIINLFNWSTSTTRKVLTSSSRRLTCMKGSFN